MKIRRVVTWGFAVVGGCTAAWYGVLLYYFGSTAIESHSLSLLQDAKYVIWPLFAGVLGLLVWYLNLAKSSFGEWLEHSGAAHIFFVSYVWSLILGVSAFVFSILGASTQHSLLIHIAAFTLLWFVFTFLSIVLNSWKLLYLRNIFQKEVRKADGAAGDSPFKSQD